MRSSACNGRLGDAAVQAEIVPVYGVRLPDTCVSARADPSVVDLPVELTCTRPNVTARTKRASKRAIRPRNSI